ncbi:EF-hand domain-containing protein [Sphingomonas sp. PAMC 26605]|uniref:EF-hand domain-containing protein n=1 Tax=Sphingomonas sp. PAMC 26605 TaxID=1112214 RepID=UPI00026CD722|nr:EF-hand domain-containing protein [Sphingomonas sp. PAMC 26605]
MVKSALLATALALATPAFAQDAPPATEPAPQSAPTAVDQAVPATQSSAARDAAIPASIVAPEAEAAAKPAAAGTPAGDIINREFAGYDKDGDGVLNAAEFDAWMVALKKASDPTTDASAPETKSYLAKAFAQADADKSKTVSKAELTAFLSQPA